MTGSVAERNHLVGRYELLHRLGRGGMGVVYEALDSRTGARVAVKMLCRNDRESYDSFRREVEVLKRLRHRAVVSFLDEGSGEREHAWYAMELLRGETLREYNSRLWNRASADSETAPMVFDKGESASRSASAFSPPREESPVASRLNEVLRIYIGIFEGLQHIHERGVILGDISPANVYVRANGSPVILDFGLASAMSPEVAEVHDASGQKRIAGTGSYLAPEQIRRERIGPRTDLYSLGCMMYETLIGMPPFGATSTAGLLHAHLEGRVTPPSEFWPYIPSKLEDLVLALLEKQPQDRPESAKGAAEQLASVVASERKTALESRRRVRPSSSTSARNLRMRTGLKAGVSMN